MSDKKYINLHAEVDEDGKLRLVDDDGRVLAGVRSKSIHTANDEASFAIVEVILKSQEHTAFARGMVKAPSIELLSKADTKRLNDEINEAVK